MVNKYIGINDYKKFEEEISNNNIEINKNNNIIIKNGKLAARVVSYKLGKKEKDKSLSLTLVDRIVNFILTIFSKAYREAKKFFEIELPKFKITYLEEKAILDDLNADEDKDETPVNESNTGNAETNNTETKQVAEAKDGISEDIFIVNKDETLLDTKKNDTTGPDQPEDVDDEDLYDLLDGNDETEENEVNSTKDTETNESTPPIKAGGAENSTSNDNVEQTVQSQNTKSIENNDQKNLGDSKDVNKDAKNQANEETTGKVSNGGLSDTSQQISDKGTITIAGTGNPLASANEKVITKSPTVELTALEKFKATVVAVRTLNTFNKLKKLIN